MSTGEIILREAAAADMPGISRVRSSVRENLLTVEQLERLGVTSASVAASLLVDRKGWVAEHGGEIVAFSMADRANRSIFALFALPDYEGCGLGGRLLNLALQWLWEEGAGRIWLTTAPGTRAQRFYEQRGWVQVGEEPGGDVRLERAWRGGSVERFE